MIWRNGYRGFNPLAACCHDTTTTVTTEAGASTQEILGSNYQASTTDNGVVGSGATSTTLYVSPGSSAGNIYVTPGSPEDLATAKAALETASTEVLGAEQAVTKLSQQALAQGGGITGAISTAVSKYGGWFVLALVILGGGYLYFKEKK